MLTIRSLRPNVTRDEAIAQFAPRGATHLLRTLAFGRLRSVAEAYVPLFLYRVQIENRGHAEERLLGIDAVTGTLDLYQFDHLPTDAETVRRETRNCPRAQLTHSQARDLLIARVRRLIYARGFFRTQDLRISPDLVADTLHIPYWLGFRGHGQSARMSVIDAVRRRPEGAKVRTLFENWLTTQA